MSEWYDWDDEDENPFGDGFEDRLREEGLEQLTTMLRDDSFVFVVGNGGTLMALHKSIFQLTDMLTRLRKTAEDIKKERGSSDASADESKK